MATSRTCKTLFTGAAIAASLFLTAGCSTDKQTHDAAAKGTESGDQAATTSDAANESERNQGTEAKGVNTNHDVFHSRALEVPAGTPVPGLAVEVEEDSVRGWNLYVGIANFTFEPVKTSSDSLPTEGHAQLYINDKPAQKIYGNWTHLPELPPGTDKLRVTLNTSGDETITTQGQPIEESVTLEVYDPNVTTN